MKNENLFKLYYLTWIKKNNIKVSYKDKLNDEKDVYELKKMSLNLEDIKNYTKDIKEISSIKKYFKNTIFLDIWIQLCNLDNKFFKEETFSIINKNITNIVETLYYISGNSLEEYIEYTDEDFSPIFSEEDFSVIGYEIGDNLRIKNALIILKQVDFELFMSIQSKVRKELTKKINNIDFVKQLWNTLEIKDNGKVEINKETLKSLEELLRKYPSAKKSCLEELTNYYELLKLSKEKQLAKIKELLF